MSKRTPPSAEAVVDALRGARADERVVPRTEAVDTLRRHFRTTKARADEWLDAVALDSDVVWDVTVSDHGFVGGLLVRNAGRWPKITATLIRSGVGEKGVTDHLFPNDSWLWLRVDRTGRFTTDRKAAAPYAWTGIVLTSTLRTICEQAEQARQADRVMREAGEIVKDAAVDSEHGAALGYLRGLLHAAGVRDVPHFTGLQTHLFTSSDEAVAEVRLRGSDIDRVAAVLQSLGVQPVAP